MWVADWFDRLLASGRGDGADASMRPNCEKNAAAPLPSIRASIVNGRARHSVMEPDDLAENRNRSGPIDPSASNCVVARSPSRWDRVEKVTSRGVAVARGIGFASSPSTATAYFRNCCAAPALAARSSPLRFQRGCSEPAPRLPSISSSSPGSNVNRLRPIWTSLPDLAIRTSRLLIDCVLS